MKLVSFGDLWEREVLKWRVCEEDCLEGLVVVVERALAGWDGCQLVVTMCKSCCQALLPTSASEPEVEKLLLLPFPADRVWSDAPSCEVDLLAFDDTGETVI